MHRNFAINNIGGVVRQDNFILNTKPFFTQSAIDM